MQAVGPRIDPRNEAYAEGKVFRQKCVSSGEHSKDTSSHVNTVLLASPAY